MTWARREWLEDVDDEMRGAAFTFIERLRTEYGELFIDLLRIACEEDPIGVQAVGMPPTEYEPKVRRIFPGLRGVQSADELRHLIHTVFVDMFDAQLAGPVDRYDRMAERMWEA